MKRYQLTLGLLACAGVLLQGCTAPGETRPDEGSAVVEERSVGPGGEGAAREGEGAQAGSAQMGRGAALHPLEDPESPLSRRVIYFEFDSSEVSAADRALVTAHAQFLSQHPEVSVVVEGHADERGSREYNLALGERRAKGVERLLNLQGTGKEQMQVISFGEERPVALGHDEQAWGLNRRVELLYSGY